MISAKSWPLPLERGSYSNIENGSPRRAPSRPPDDDDVRRSGLPLRSLITRVGLYNGVEGYVLDDIDHLGNRRTRSVGELLANQLSVGLNRMSPRDP